MSGLIFFLMVASAFVTLGAFAQAFGVDTRPDFEDSRAPAGGLTT